MNSTRQTARFAGLIYLLLAVTGIFGLVYVPSSLIESGNAAATADNIKTAEPLFRAGIFVGLLSNIIYALLVFVLFRLLKNVNLNLAVLMVALALFGACTGFANAMNQIAVLIVLGGADFLSAFGEQELDALAFVFLRFYSHGLHAVQIFWGLWLFPFGMLAYRSGFIPRFLGVLLIIAGFGYLAAAFTYFVLPSVLNEVAPVLNIIVWAELPIIFWLLIWGTRSPPAEHEG